MSANNFLDDNPKSKEAGKGQDEAPDVKWTEPAFAKQEPIAKSDEGFFDLFKDTGKNIKKNKQSADAGEFADRKKALSEYSESLEEEKERKKDITKKTKEVERPWTLKTNLIKEDVTTFVNWQKNIVLSVLGLVFTVLLIGGGYGYLVFKEYKNVKEEKSLSAEIAGLEERIREAKQKATEADAFQKKIKTVSELLDKHVYWSEFFKFLEENTLADTFYTGAFSGDVKSDFTFSVAAKSYQSIDDQLRVFRANEKVISAKADAASFEDSAKSDSGSGNISYELELKLSPEVFKKPK